MNMITFRLDDITPDMNWEIFELLDQVFTDTGIFPLLGIVPDNQDDGLKMGKEKTDFWSYMYSLQKKGYTLAQHGYQHLYETLDSGILKINPFSEFAGLPYEKQEEKIRAGREILKNHGIQTDIFMAPGHTFDKITLEALQKNEFRILTDGYSNRPYRYMGMCFYPSTLSEPAMTSGVNTICLHPNLMTKEDVESLRNFIEFYREYVFSFGDMLKKANVTKYTIFIFAIIKKNLFIREVKDFAANNQAVSRYMQKTFHKNKLIKLVKRVICFPSLFPAFLSGRTK